MSIFYFCFWGKLSRFRSGSGGHQLKTFCLILLLGALVSLGGRAEAQFPPISLPGGALVKMVADYQRPYIYALQAPAPDTTNGSLLFINTTSGTLVKTLTVGANPTDVAVSPADDAIFVINAGSRTISKVDLSSFTVVAEKPILTVDSYNMANPLHLVAATPNLLYYTDGAWAPQIYSFDYAAGTNNLMLNTGGNVSNGAGGMAMSPYMSGLVYIWTQYGWNAGSASSAIVRLVAQTGGFSMAETGSQQSRDPLDTPIFIDAAARWVFNKKQMVMAGDVAAIINQFSENIYAIMPDGSLAFGPTQVFETQGASVISFFPAGSTVQAISADQERLFRYDGATSNLLSYSVASLKAPAITQQPTNQQLYRGQSATMSVSAIGLGPLCYYWSFNGNNFAQTTNAQTTISSVQLTNAGTYSVIVSNAFGFAVSSNASLSVIDSAPIILTQPQGQIAAAGSNVVLVSQASGSQPLFFQWRFNGQNIGNGTNASLPLNNLQVNNQGNYDVIISNAFGFTNSAIAFLNVVGPAEALNTTNITWLTGGDVPWMVQTDPTAQDLWGNGYPATHDGVASMQSGNTAAGQQSILETTVTGPATLTFWVQTVSYNYYDQHDFLTFSINGTEQSRLLDKNYWQQQTHYLGVGINQLRWNYETDLFWGEKAQAWLDQVNVTTGSTPPLVQSNPGSQDVIVGSNVILNALVVGTPPLSCQWQFNGANLAGATNATLTLTNVQFANEGNYVLLATSPFGVTNTLPAFVNAVDFAESLNAPNLTWSSGGDKSWFPETGITHDGSAALQSGAISGSQQSTVATTVSGPGTLIFWWKVSSETNNDYVNFTVDGVEQSRNSGILNQWLQKTFYLASGPHSLAWNYIKNATLNNGSDAAWLDQVAYVPGGAAAYAVSGPADQIVPIASNANFAVTAGGTPPISYQWLFNGSQIPSATNSTLSITNVQVTNSGNYSVWLANDYGNNTSTNAFLYLLNMYAWGAGKTNTAILPNSGQSIVPTNLFGIKAIAGGGYHSMALLNSGRVVSWGYNLYGQTNNQSTLTNATAIAAGLMHSLALRSNGLITAWGYSAYNQTVVPLAATNIMAIAAGTYHSLALRSNGTVVAWGAGSFPAGYSPNYGQSIVPTNLSGVTAIAAGGYHSLALRTNGTVVAWGWNAFGQTNVPAGLSNVVAIAAGSSNSMALKRDGTLVAWGANGNGQTNLPDGLTNVVAISCGGAHNLALLNDGSLLSWGLNGNGQTNVPVNATNVTAVAAGGSHSLALVNVGPVTFLNPPYGQRIFKGGEASFNPAVLGLAPIHFQWQQNGTNVPGATNTGLQIAKAQRADAGSYQLLASNAFGVVSSAVAVLVVEDPAPFFTVQPTNVTVLQNSQFTLSAVVGGQPPLAYQWCLQGAPIAGATNLVLTVTNAQLTNEGFYTLLATNADGAAVSSNALVDVIDLPQALGLTNVAWFNPGQPVWFVEGTNTHDHLAAVASGPLRVGDLSMLRTFVEGPGKLTFWCGGNQSAWLSFAIDDAELVNQQFFNSGVWQQFTYYLPAKVHMLTWMAMNQSSPYYSNIVFLDDVVFTPGNTAATITSQPSSQTNLAGNNITFRVAAAGTPPLKYQWYFNGVALPGAILASLELNDIQLNNTGNYSVVVNGPGNTIVSSSAGLTVLPSAPLISPQPAGGAVLLGSTFTFGGGATGTEPLYYQWQFNGQPIAGANTPTLTLNNVQYPAGGSYTLLASNSAGVAVSSNALLLPYSLGDLGAAVDKPSETWITTNVPWFPQTNITHDGVSAAQSGVISGRQSSTLQTTVTGPAMVVYWWKVDCDSFWDALAFSVNGSQQSSIAGTVDWQQNTNYIGSGSQTLQWSLYPVANAFASGTGWVDQVQIIPIAGVAPAITAQTGDLSTNAGNTVTLSATATGTPRLYYQWQFNGAEVPGGTNSTLVLTNVQIVNAGTYSVTITNDFGWAAGTDLNLTVNNSAPVITRQPAGQTNIGNSVLTFTVAAKGSTPLSYQWFFNGVPLNGAISSLLNVTNSLFAGTGDYFVVVSNNYGQATSAVARLTVTPSKVIDYLPYGRPAMAQPADIGNVTAIAAGTAHTAALRKDGTVIVWGNNFFGQTNVPSGLSNVVAIAAGNNHTLALKADGTLAAWGDYGYGQGSVPEGVSNVVAIASGPAYNLALQNDGQVIGWGDDSHGQTDIPAGLTNVQAIWAGYYNGCALKADGSLVQWGTGPVWQHNGGDAQLTFPGSNIVSIAAAAFTGWSLQNDGIVHAHGFFDGAAPFTNRYQSTSTWSTDTRAPSVYFNVIAVAASGTGSPIYDYVLLLNDSGLITEVNGGGLPAGIGNNTIPYITSNPGNITAIAANSQHAVGLITDGSPRINWSPLSRIVFSGDTVAFNMSASGTLPLNYQWQFNGTNISNATNSLLVLTNVPLTAAGNYWCVVTNNAGSATSQSASLSVLRSTLRFGGTPAFIDGSFGWQLDRLSGHGNIIILGSTNLVDWVPIFTNPPVTGSILFFEPGAGNQPNRFYRAIEQ